MPRPLANPATVLGIAVQARRGGVDVGVPAAALGVSRATLYRVEAGTHEPSFNTALALARWLGEDWTVEKVMEAARSPATGTAPR